MAPLAVIAIAPFASPWQFTSVTPPTTAKAEGSNNVKDWTRVQPLASVTVTWYEPAMSPPLGKSWLVLVKPFGPVQA